MKLKFLLAILFGCIFQNLVSGQLKLQTVNGKRKITIPSGTEISIKMPTETAKTTCECFQMVRGILKNYHSDTISMKILEQERRYFVDTSIGKSVVTQFGKEGNLIDSPIFAKDVLSISKHFKSRKNLDNLGGTLMMLAGFQSLVVGPLLPKNLRKGSDKIVWGGFGLGLFLVALPNKKTYYFQNQKKKNKRLWQFSQ